MRPWVAFALAAMSAAAGVLIWKADEFGRNCEDAEARARARGGRDGRDHQAHDDAGGPRQNTIGG